MEIINVNSEDLEAFKMRIFNMKNGKPNISFEFNQNNTITTPYLLSQTITNNIKSIEGFKKNNNVTKALVKEGVITLSTTSFQNNNDIKSITVDDNYSLSFSGYSLRSSSIEYLNVKHITGIPSLYNTNIQTISPWNEYITYIPLLASLKSTALPNIKDLYFPKVITINSGFLFDNMPVGANLENIYIPNATSISNTTYPFTRGLSTTLKSVDVRNLVLSPDFRIVTAATVGYFQQIVTEILKINIQNISNEGSIRHFHFRHGVTIGTNTKVELYNNNEYVEDLLPVKKNFEIYAANVSTLSISVNRLYIRKKDLSEFIPTEVYLYRSEDLTVSTSVYRASYNINESELILNKDFDTVGYYKLLMRIIDDEGRIIKIDDGFFEDNTRLLEVNLKKCKTIGSSSELHNVFLNVKTGVEIHVNQTLLTNHNGEMDRDLFYAYTERNCKLYFYDDNLNLTNTVNV